MQISVIIPTYNRALIINKLLDRWVEIHRNTKYEYELIISDDGSTDQTMSVINEYKNLPIVFLSNEHGGPGNARNSAIKISKGELLLFTGDDILPEKDFVNLHYENYLKYGPKCATLGRIEWDSNIKISHLMYHITNVGGEQFGYNFLTPFSFVGFQFFYTSNISVSASEIAILGEGFNPSFDKANFEDIELGYRLTKNGVKIYYSPNIIGYHNHIYDNIENFCNRQFIAGQMISVFFKLHPELSVSEISIDISRFTKYYRLYQEKYPLDILCMIGLAIGVCLKYITKFLEYLIDKTGLSIFKQVCSIIYHFIFKLYLYAGLANGLDNRSLINRNEQLRFSLRYLFTKSHYSQLIWGFDLNPKFLSSTLFELIGEKEINIDFTFPNDHVRVIRFYPIKKRCRVKNFFTKVIFLDNSCEIINPDVFIHLNDNILNIFRINNPKINYPTFNKDIRSIHISFEIDNKYGPEILRFIKRVIKYILKFIKRGLKFLNIFYISPKNNQIIVDYVDVSPKFAPIWIRVVGLEGRDILYRYKEICEVLLPSVIVSTHPCINHNYREYIYFPQNDQTAMDEFQLLNAAFSLCHQNYDFIILSDGLDYYPSIWASSITDSVIFSSKFNSLDTFIFSEIPVAGKFIRLQGIRRCKNKINGNNYLKNINTFKNGELIRGTAPSQGTYSTKLLNSRNKLKPLIIVLPTFMAVGGAERNIIEVMRRLSKSFDFLIVTYERHSPQIGSLMYQAYEVSIAYYELAEIADINNYLQILSDLKKVYDPDLVWIPNSNPWCYDNLSNIREIFIDVPMIAQDVYDFEAGWINYYGRPAAKSYDRYIAINLKIRSKFINTYSINENKIDLIYHAIDTNKIDQVNKSELDRDKVLIKYGLNPNNKIFAFIGRLTDQKQPLMFINLAVLLMQEYNDVEFVLVGNGPLEDMVNKDLEKHPGGNKIHRIPFIESIYEFTKSIDGLILTSLYEGLPIVAIEAMCVGTPILSTNVGDLDIFIAKYDIGVIIGGFDIDNLHDGFLKFFKNLNQYKNNSASAIDQNNLFFSSNRAAKLTETSFSKGMKDYVRPKNILLSKKEEPLVSVIIPCFNHENFIKEAIESILFQTYGNFKLIIIDDGSNDNSVEIIENINDDRIMLIKQDNKGAHNAINLGLSSAKGKYIAILNSDDIFHPDKLRQSINFLEINSDTALVCSYIETINSDGAATGIKMGWHNMPPWPMADKTKTFSSTDSFAKNLLMANFISTTSNMVFRNSIIKKIGGMRNLRFVHDWDFALRIAEEWKCGIIENPLIQYRLHNSNTINSNRKHLMFEICWIYAVHLPIFEQNFLFEDNSLKDLALLFESVNLQGNDKLMWAIRSYISAMKSKGISDPEQILLIDKEIQKSLFDLIQ